MLNFTSGIGGDSGDHGHSGLGVLVLSGSRISDGNIGLFNANIIDVLAFHNCTLVDLIHYR